MRLELEGTHALIAGSSRGIGLGIARAFLAEGANVVVTGRDADRLGEAARSLESEFGSARVLGVACDLRREEDVRRCFATAIARFGPVGSVVANVGSGTAPGGWDVPSDAWREVLDMNLLCSMEVARAALEHLVESGRGTLTFVSSIAGREHIGAPLPYAAAKAGLELAARGMAKQVGPRGVRVNCVSPGNVLFEGGTWERKMAERGPFFQEMIDREVALQRFGTPEEIASVVVFLASPRASFVTGACVVVDGGQVRSG